MDVSLVRWPAESERREQLRAQSRPRLLLIEQRSAPPEDPDIFEDWVRLPAEDRDVKARVNGLQLRVEHFGPTQPRIDDGVIRFRTQWTAVTGVEGRMAVALIDRFGTVVSRDALLKAGWPDGNPRQNSLHVHVLRLRRRLEPIGLVIRTVRSRGYLLEAFEEREETG